MTSTSNKVSARERARSATAVRLAEEQARIKKNENDLAAFFKADEVNEKARSDADARIARIREETSEKLVSSDETRAASVLALKTRGESIASIATMTGLTSTEVNKLLKSARAASKPASKVSPASTSTKPPKADSGTEPSDSTATSATS